MLHFVKEIIEALMGVDLVDTFIIIYSSIKIYKYFKNKKKKGI